MVKNHHIQPRYHPLLYPNFSWLNVKAAMAHHPVIKKGVDEPLAKGAIESSTTGVGFYSNVFVVPGCNGG